MNAPAHNVPAWTHGGLLENIADVDALVIDWRWIASTLAGLPRFGKKHSGLGVSVAQHCVMGADALHRETGDTHLAALFLLHDAHEYVVSDLTTPVVKLLALFVEKRFPCAYRNGGRVEKGIADMKAAIDRIIYRAALLDPPALWQPRDADAVKAMDRRMFEAEALALYGPRAFDRYAHSGLPAPKLVGAILPAWGIAKAEEAWLDRLSRYCGITPERLA